MSEKEALEFLRDNLSGHSRVTVRSTDDIPSTIVSRSGDTRIESLEEFQSQPNRIKRVIEHLTCESMCKYVDRFKQEGSSIYLNTGDGKFVAVLDHHEPGEPEWSDHRAWYAPKKSLNWQAWSGIHKKAMSQVELALFIEENLDDINKPEPNEMLRAALDFQTVENMTFSSSNNLDNGNTNFLFKKDNATSTVEFPHRIELYLPVFEGESSKFYEARLRFRVDNNGSLSFTFSFVKDPRAVVYEALKSIAAEIKSQLADITQYEGKFSGR